MDRLTVRLVEMIRNASRIVGFTGAGISTESGISDYRSKGGLWERFSPVYFQEFLQDEEKRKLYWRRKLEMWPSIKNAEPNTGHNFFKTLFNRDKLLGIITQNIDGLHGKSGIPEDKIVRLHGTNLEIICLECGRTIPAEDILDSFGPNSSPPRCSECGGLLKPNTVSFGQNLDPSEILRAEELAVHCDCMLCFGSTLVVYPAAELPVLAGQRGASVAVVTLSDTPLDETADVVIHRPIGEVVADLVNELRW